MKTKKKSLPADMVEQKLRKPFHEAGIDDIRIFNLGSNKRGVSVFFVDNEQVRTLRKRLKKSGFICHSIEFDDDVDFDIEIGVDGYVIVEPTRTLLKRLRDEHFEWCKEHCGSYDTAFRPSRMALHNPDNNWPGCDNRYEDIEPEVELKEKTLPF